MTPRLVSCYFAGLPATAAMWPRLARVLRRTASRHCPEWSIECLELELAAITSCRAMPADAHNTQKLEHWAAAVAAAPVGARLLLIDTDTMILRGLDEAWGERFDLGLTRRPSGYPFNAGVVFVRVSPLVRAFFGRWCEENRRMLVDRAYHLRWQGRYGGINQAALGALMETGAADCLRIHEFPCAEWNCEDMTWAAFSEETRILHIKSGLRLVVFPNNYEPMSVQAARRTPTLVRLANIWLSAEEEAKNNRPSAGMEATP